MGAAIREKHADAEVELIEGGRGDFVVKNDGAELWNKRAMGDEFPENDVILEKLAS
ncbi:MAG: hypothetical protein QGG14_08480 [Planctomycetota bacterium]|nr:hypothetical protein [Planctomycetota bacterium]